MPGRAADGADYLVRFNVVTIFHEPVNQYIFINLAVGFFKPVKPAEHTVFAADDGCQRHIFMRDQLCGYVAITDRTKDVIKSGGEWISSIELENTAMGHPAIAEAAVIGVAHPKWTERPLLVVTRAEGKDVSKEELLAYFQGKVATWWVPNDVVFVDELPHTATGKVKKIELRKQFAEYRLPD